MLSFFQIQLNIITMIFIKTQDFLPSHLLLCMIKSTFSIHLYFYVLFIIIYFAESVITRNELDF